METADDTAILLFDGVCNLCNGFVQFVLPRDGREYFRFASLQSETGQQLLREAGMPVDEISTVVLYENGRFFTHSDVGLRVVRRLSGLWPMLYIFFIVPKPIRDAIYNWVARNRYRWFGKRERCMIPTPEYRSRFVDQ